ncbi:phosphoadenosine phosphosulfate reductase [Rubricella aquisinus]|uniref:Adenosine 5'-phosphosulfate reductase n=2 Tax=Rubricella aquisinus TaxID=2028108 RepID=A0A840X578_9RHOB|nr:phosphoadenylyl-sulfate reductase [Rubricella aquisinus]MBB5515857.1 phosphoadenosine phosphosulfate reductase [Rubricella aquisinus]
MRPDPKRIAALNAFYEGQGAEVILAHAVGGLFGGRVAMVSSFGAESVVLLHLMAEAEPHTPVLFADTQMLFAETLKYQQEVAETLGLIDIRRIAPDPAELLAEDRARDLHIRDSDACCDLRKVRPLERALREFDVILSGRKRHQASTRAALPLFEQDADGRIKINPLANWGREEIAAYFDQHALPRHPLVAQGYPSIGCAPCTTPVAAGEDPRAGRWRGQDKEECGIHFIDGRAVRGPLTAA